MKMTHPPSIEQRISTAEELEISIQLIGTGLDKLREISGSNDFYFLPMLLLSSGYERLMKVVICLFSWFVHEVPGPGKTHNLVELKNRIVDECFRADYLNRQVGRDSLAFIKTGPLLSKLVEILSAFNESGRYYDLDVVFGDKKSADDSPKRLWERVELDVLQRAPDWKEKLESPDDTAYEHVIPRMVEPLEKFAKALCFLIVTGGTDDMRQCTSAVSSLVKKYLGEWELIFQKTF